MSPARWYLQHGKPDCLIWLGVRLSVQLVRWRRYVEGYLQIGRVLPGLSAFERKMSEKKGIQSED